MKQKTALVSTCAYLMAGACLMAPADSLAKSIAKDQVNLRSGPSQSSDILLTAPQGYPIEVIKTLGKWTQYRDWQHSIGWVYSSLVSDIETAVILVEKANIRSGVGTSTTVVATAAVGEIYKILDRQNNWVQLGYYEASTALGWIRADLVFGE